MVAAATTPVAEVRAETTPPAPASEDLSVYISGPMTGYEDFNFPAFYKVEAWLRRAGYVMIVNPARLDDDLGMPCAEEDLGTAKAHHAFMQRDLPLVSDTDLIALMPGWRASKGANYELAVAHMTGSGVIDVPYFVTMSEPFEFGTLAWAEPTWNSRTFPDWTLIRESIEGARR